MRRILFFARARRLARQHAAEYTLGGMNHISRRAWLGAAGAAAAALPALAASGAAPAARRNRIHQSAARWCYAKIPLDDLCRAGAALGLAGIDLLGPDEWDVPRRHGLICTMGYAGANDIYNGLNRPENLPAIESAFAKNLPLAEKSGVPNVICFSGARRGMPDDQGADNCIAALRRLTPMCADHGVTLCMEILNSKIDHPDYMCDHVAWGVSVARAVNSPRLKLLFDLYHVQIMQGDLIRTLQTNGAWIGHFHTGGVPHRHELDGTQEVQWDGVMRGIVASGFQGYVAHEFLPTRDPLTSLGEAVALCDV